MRRSKRQSSYDARLDESIKRSLISCEMGSFLLMESKSASDLQTKIEKLQQIINGTPIADVVDETLESTKLAISNLQTAAETDSGNDALPFLDNIVTGTNSTIDKFSTSIVSMIKNIVDGALDRSKKTAARSTSAGQAAKPVTLDQLKASDKSLEDLIKFYYFINDSTSEEEQVDDPSAKENLKRAGAQIDTSVSMSKKLLVLLRNLGAKKINAPGMISHLFSRVIDKVRDKSENLGAFAKGNGTWIETGELKKVILGLSIEEALEIADRMGKMSPASTRGPSTAVSRPSATSTMGTGNATSKLSSILSKLGEDEAEAKRKLAALMNNIIPGAKLSDDQSYVAQLDKIINRVKAARALEDALGLKLESVRRDSRRNNARRTPL